MIEVADDDNLIFRKTRYWRRKKEGKKTHTEKILLKIF